MPVETSLVGVAAPPSSAGTLLAVTPCMTTEHRVTVRHVPTSTEHIVWAAGGPDDGTLIGLATACGKHIDDSENWVEMPERFGDLGVIECRDCLDRLSWLTTRPEEATRPEGPRGS